MSRSFWVVALAAVLAVVGTYLWQHADVTSAQGRERSLTTEVRALHGHADRLSSLYGHVLAQVHRLEMKVHPPVYVRGATCRPSQLVLEEDGNSAAGLANRAALFSLTNVSQVACVLDGYPSFHLLQADGAPAPWHGEQGPTAHRGNMFTSDPGAHVVEVAEGASVYFSVGWFATGLAGPPATYAYAAVDLPAGTTPLFVAVHDFSDWASTTEVTAIGDLSGFNTARLGTQIPL